MDPESSRNRQGEPPGRLPDLAIESFARGFHKEALSYGFSQVDFVRFVNQVLGMSMAGRPAPGEDEAEEETVPPALDEELPVSDGNVEVRAFDPTRDPEVLSRWMQDPQGRMFLLEGTMTRWRTLDEIVADPGTRIALVTLTDGTPIGAMAFLDIRQDHQRAEMRKLIGESTMRGRGYAKAATRLWIGYGFGTLGLRKIYINTLNTNIRNIRLNEALGFRLEGILRDEVKLDDRWRDVLRMAIWRD